MRHPEQQVAVLERGLLPSGASTKNAGFACFGSISELKDDLETMGERALVDLVLLRYEGLVRMRELLGDEKIDYRPVGGFELLFETANRADIDFYNDLLQPALGKRPFREQAMDAFPFGAKVKGVVANELEGSVHTGKMLRTLQARVAAAGVQLFTGADVLSVEERAQDVRLEVAYAGGQLQFTAQQVAVCNNAFARSFLPELDLVPGRGAVLVTKPIPGLRLNGTFHYHSGYHYFRTVEDRLLLGGGRQLDFQGEQTTSFGLNQLIINQLEEDLREFIVPHLSVEVDYAWSGIMAFGSDPLPYVSRVSPRMVAGVRLSGMGVAIASKVGQEVAALLTS